jgi:hypothetical protein
MRRSPFAKYQGPDGKFHPGWCGVFEGEACSCGDGRKKPPRRRPGPLSGAPAAKKELEETS